eukprot:1303264-Rhodomonas_salina.1
MHFAVQQGSEIPPPIGALLVGGPPHRVVREVPQIGLVVITCAGSVRSTARACRIIADAAKKTIAGRDLAARSRVRTDASYVLPLDLQVRDQLLPPRNDAIAGQ